MIKGSLLDRVIKSGNNPIKLLFDDQPFVCTDCDLIGQENGMIDSLRFLLHQEDYNKPWSDEHILVTLLTKAF